MFPLGSSSLMSWLERDWSETVTGIFKSVMRLVVGGEARMRQKLISFCETCMGQARPFVCSALAMIILYKCMVSRQDVANARDNKDALMRSALQHSPSACTCG